MRLHWELLDLKQKAIELGGEPVTFDKRLPGANVEVGLNAARRATLSLALDDPVRDLLAPLETVLRVTLIDGEDETPIFIGRLGSPEEQGGEEGRSISVTAVDPLAQLMTLLVRSVREQEGATIWEAMGFGYENFLVEGPDQSAVMWALVASATGHGVREGTLAASSGMHAAFQVGASIGQTLIDISQVSDGIDFELVPVIAADGTLCELTTHYPRQGSDKSATVRFVYGADPETAVAFSHAPSADIVNRVIVNTLGGIIGNDGAAMGTLVVEHPASIARFGPYEQMVDASNYVGVSGFYTWPEQIAKGILEASALPVDFFSITPAPERPDGSESGPPRFGPTGDYWVGDTIGADVYRPGASEPLELEGRITDATITESASGQLSTALTCAPEPDAEAVTTSDLVFTFTPNTTGDAE